MSKNYKELKEFGKSLCELCMGLKKTDSLENFQKADFAKLDRKLFSEVILFLLELIASDLVHSQLSLVANQAKPQAVFVKEVFQIISQIKERHPWTNKRLGTFQKSHFQDPRPEQGKVVDFLKQLLSVTFFIVSGAEPGQKIINQLETEIATSEQQAEKLRESQRLAEIELKTTQQRLLEVEAEFTSNEEILRERGIIVDEPCSRETLLKYIHSAEEKLLNKIDALMRDSSE